MGTFFIFRNKMTRIERIMIIYLSREGLGTNPYEDTLKHTQRITGVRAGTRDKRAFVRLLCGGWLARGGGDNPP